MYAVNLQSSSFRRLTEAQDTTPGNGDSAEPVLSGSGRFVVFRTSATNLFPLGAGPDQLALLDRDADANGIFDEPGTALFEAVSVSPAGAAGDAPSSSVEVSDDGRFVAFRSGASNLVADDTNGVWDVFLRDRQTGITRRINVRPAGQESHAPVNALAISMTPDGRFIAYVGGRPAGGRLSGRHQQYRGRIRVRRARQLDDAAGRRVGPRRLPADTFPATVQRGGPR